MVYLVARYSAFSWDMKFKGKGTTYSNIIRFEKKKWFSMKRQMEVQKHNETYRSVYIYAIKACINASSPIIGFNG
jgi:hypothetical protein